MPKKKSEMYRNPNLDNSLSVLSCFHSKGQRSTFSFRNNKAPYNILDVKKAYDQVKLLHTRLLYIYVFLIGFSENVYEYIKSLLLWQK